MLTSHSLFEKIASPLRVAPCDMTPTPPAGFYGAMTKSRNGLKPSEKPSEFS
jgi:hypothetical protein